MVCNRCIMVVSSVFEKMGLEPEYINLGEVKLSNDISIEEKQHIATELEQYGFFIIDDKQSKLI